MARTDIGPRIGIDGEKEFRAQLRQIDTGLKTLGSEMKLVTSEFIGNERSVEALTAQNQVLERTSYSLSEKLELQRKRLQEAAQAYGEADERTQKLQQAVNKTETELNQTTAAIKKNETAVRDLSEAEDGATGSGKSLAGILGESGGVSIPKGAAATTLVITALAASVKKYAEFCVAAVKSGSEYADSILTLGTNFGISAERLQEYQYMAELTDTSVDTITGSLSKLTKSMDSARKGTGDAASAFSFLGINILDSTGELRDSEEVFDLVIQRLGHIGNETERDALSMAIFGKSAQDLNSLIAVGADGLANFRREAHDAGYVLSGDALNALGAVDDQFARLDKTTEAIKNQIALEFAPELIDITGKALDFAQSVDWSAVGKTTITILKGIGLAIKGLLLPITNVIDGFRNMAQDAKEAANAIARLFGKQKKDESAGYAYLDSLPTLASPLPSSPSYARTASAAPQTQAAASTPIVVDITQTIDGRVLAQNQYTYNQEEAARRGSPAVR